VRGHPLVAHIDNFYSLVETAIVNINNVTAGVGEDVLHAFLFEHARNDLSSGHCPDDALHYRRRRPWLDDSSQES
jgi:microcompartment protein CcmK/EutM